MILIALKKAWTWVKANWKWILFPVGLLLLFLALNRKKTVGSTSLLEAGEVKDDAREEANKRIEEAGQEREKKIQQIEEDHADTIAKLTEAQKGRVEELRGDPDELNSFLLNVGKEIRK